MNLSFYLVVNNRGTTKVMKNRPDVRWDEVAIQFNLRLPDAIFRKPQLTASITIPDEAAVEKLISAEVYDNVKDAIEQASGMQVKLEMVLPKEENIIT